MTCSMPLRYERERMMEGIREEGRVKEDIGGETGREARTRSTHFSSLPPLPPSLLLQGNLPFDIYDKVLEVYGEDAAKLVRFVIIIL